MGKKRDGVDNYEPREEPEGLERSTDITPSRRTSVGELVNHVMARTYALLI